MSSTTLFTRGNPKTLKGEKFGYLTYILHLAPSRLSGFNVCPMASPGCATACLNTAGHGGIFKAGENTNIIQDARIRKTLWFFNDRESFMNQLVKETKIAIKNSPKDMIPVFRLNGTSDIRWETIPVVVDGIRYQNIMLAFPGTIYYDYSALPNRKSIPPNYKLTFSRKENNDSNVKLAIKNGLNVAVVFRKDLPKTYLGLNVINGDESDLRFLDPKNVIVGLKSKGRGKKDMSGFVLDI